MGELGNADFGELTKGLQRVAARTNLAPARIIGAVLTLWFKHSFPALRSEPKSVPLALKGDPNIDEFVSMLLGQPLLDATYWMSSAYAQLVGHERRKSLSMFFTPPPLTARLLDDLQNQQVRFDRGVFLDPACGGSAFLIPVAQRMKSALKSAGKSAAEIVRHVESNLIGIDIDPVLCMLSRQFLRAVLAEEISASDIEPKFGITCGNALQDPALIDGKADVLLCNPPYRKMT